MLTLGVDTYLSRLVKFCTVPKRRQCQGEDPFRLKENYANVQLLNKNCIAHWVRQRVEEEKMDFQKGDSFKPVRKMEQVRKFR